MLPDDRDVAYLWDMLDAARAVEIEINYGAGPSVNPGKRIHPLMGAV
jgi:hypothetical protein